MATTIFLILNAMGVAFLLYALVNFWKEAIRAKTDVRPVEFDFMQEEKQSVLVVTRPISPCAQGGGNVIPLQVRERGLAGRQDHRDRAGTIYELRDRRFSAN
jgi:hypothetical protein